MDGVVAMSGGWTSVWPDELSSMVEDKNGGNKIIRAKMICSDTMIDLE